MNVVHKQNYVHEERVLQSNSNEKGQVRPFYRVSVVVIVNIPKR
jgi:hypothetical protein